MCTHTHTHTHSDATAKLNCPYNIMRTVHTYAGTLLQYTDTYLTASYTVYITTYYTILTACTLTALRNITIPTVKATATCTCYVTLHNNVHIQQLKKNVHILAATYS